MNRDLRVTRRELPCAMGVRRRFLSIKIALAIAAIAAVLSSCDSHISSNPHLENEWVTNCVGLEFSQFSQDGKVGPGPERPVFKVNDQLVLSIPTKNRPSADKFDHAPRECRQIGDLPPAPYLYFVIWGNWSAGYRTEEVPSAELNRCSCAIRSETKRDGQKSPPSGPLAPARRSRFSWRVRSPDDKVIEAGTRRQSNVSS